MKKVFLFIALCMASVSAHALQIIHATIDGIAYDLDPNNYEAQVNWLDGYVGTDVVIPDAVNYTGGGQGSATETDPHLGTYTVTSISRAFYLNSDLTSITIGKNVRELENNAFYYCENLETITFAVGSIMTKIGETAFYNCRKLKNIVNFPSGITTIEARAFEDCRALESIDIPAGVTTLSEGLFTSCRALDNVYIPGTVKTVSTNAFANCTAMTKVTLAEGITTLQAGCFYNCTGLGQVTIPASVTSMTGNPFSLCTGLTSITIAPGNTSYIVSDGVVFNSSRTQLVFCLVTKTGAYSVPAGVTTIASSAFSKCSGLTAITLPATVSEIGYSAFIECTGLTEMTIPEGVTTIYSGTLGGCTSLKTVRLPSTITHIYSQAFAAIGKALEKFYIYATSVPSTSSDIFYSTTISGATLIVPEAALEAYKAAKPWYGFGNIRGELPGDVEQFTAKTAEGVELTVKVIDRDAMTAKIGDGTNAAVAVGTAGPVTLPSEVKGFSLTSIAANAFKNCNAITEITIPAGMAVESGAFSGNTALATVRSLSLEAYDIAADAFDADTYSHATLLVAVNQADAFAAAQGWKQFKTIGGFIPEGLTEFSVKNAEGLTLNYIVKDREAMTVEVGKKESWGYSTILSPLDNGPLIIPAEVLGCRVVGIADNAFSARNYLTSLSIPSTVTTIGNAFGGCSGITTVTVDADNPVYDSRNGCNAIIETATNKLVVGFKTTVIPGSVTTIGTYAFSNCGLTRIVIPATVTYINRDAFFNITNACKFIAESSAPIACDEEAFDVRSGNELYVPQGAIATYQAAQGWKAFSTIREYYPESVSTFTATLADNVSMTFKILDHEAMTVQIGDGTSAAISTTTAGSLEMPTNVNGYSVVAIGSKAFANCSGLTVITIPTTNPDIASKAFSGNTALERVICKGNAYDIAADAFDSYAYNNTTLEVKFEYQAAFAVAQGWKEFKNVDSGMTVGTTFTEANADGVDITYTVTSLSPATVNIGKDENTLAIDKELNEWVTIPSVVNGFTVTGVAPRAFASCWDLKGVTLPPTITTLSEYAFYSACFSSSLELPEGITTIPYNAFMFAYSEHYTLPSTLKTIARGAFQYSQVLSVTIPASVETIGNDAFASCRKLNSVRMLSATPIAISSSAFPTRANIYLYVPQGSKEAYAAADYWKDFKEIVEVAEGSEPLLIGDTFTEENADGIAVTYALTSPTTVSVGLNYNNEGLDSGVTGVVTIPQEVNGYTVTSVATWALSSCKVTSFILPPTLTTIEDYALSFCTKMTFITIPASVETIGNKAFYYCGKLTCVVVEGTTPPVLTETSFPTHADITLYVPKGSKALYEAADYWKEFKAIIEMQEGDANGDESVDMADAVSVVNFILGNPASPFVIPSADTNGDRKITITDAVSVVDVILGEH